MTESCLLKVIRDGDMKAAYEKSWWGLAQGFQQHYIQSQKAHGLILPGTPQMETAAVGPKQSTIQSKSTLRFFLCGVIMARLGRTGAPEVKIFFLLLDMSNCVNFSQFCVPSVPWLFCCEEQHYLLQPENKFPCAFIPEYSGSSRKKFNRICPDKGPQNNYLDSFDLILVSWTPKIIQLPDAGF